MAALGARVREAARAVRAERRMRAEPIRLAAIDSLRQVRPRRGSSQRRRARRLAVTNARSARSRACC
ncbi:hypothetical protein WG70_03270 [Burkholderia oklahomensis EO147]|nr:hypothetical protein WG70_03270 [Burkholderia oklahomensis EO147]KUY63248.1 hypothetical protein WG70_04140 [Burkholderia oklahomensis EO147]